MLIMAGIVYPYIYVEFNFDGDLLNTLIIITAVVVNALMIFLIGEITYVFMKHKDDKDKLEERKWYVVKKMLIEACEEIEKDPNKKVSSNDISRKMLHLINPLVISLIFGLNRLLNVYIGFAYWWIITIAFPVMLMFAIGDFFRLYRYEYLPKWARKLYCNGIDPKEFDSFSGVIPIVIALIPFLFVPIPILFATTFLTSFSDAMASLIGKKFGKRKLSKTSKKTVVGLIAGGITTFMICFITFTLSVEIPISLGKSLLMSIVASILFMILDAFTLKISDNMLNPLICGGGMVLIFYLL
jgi:dolichol kinase